MAEAVGRGGVLLDVEASQDPAGGQLQVRFAEAIQALLNDTCEYSRLVEAAIERAEEFRRVQEENLGAVLQTISGLLRRHLGP